MGDSNNGASPHGSIRTLTTGRSSKDSSPDPLGVAGKMSTFKKSRISPDHYRNGSEHNGNSSVASENGAAAASTSKTQSNRVELTSATDKEVVRIVGQHLHTLGLRETVECLIRESGCQLEHAAASKFRQHVLDGQWSLVDNDLASLQSFLENPEKLTEMKFLICEQRYLELLESGKVIEALVILREHLTPLKFNTERVHRLSTYLMYNNPSDLHRAASWDGTGPVARQKLLDRLQAFLPPAVMLPPRRLEALLRQALELQRERCPHHTTHLEVTVDSQSLLVDHKCSAGSFPTKTRQILTEHCDEVWYCQFSHNGRYLATGSKEPTVLIWEVDPVTRVLSKVFTLDGHTYGAAFFAWSPNDKYLAVVAPDDAPDLWVWDIEAKGTLKVRISQSPEDGLSCVTWHRDSEKFVCGGAKGQFYFCDVGGNLLDSWEGVRLRSVWFKRDGRTVLAADTHNRLRSYSFDDPAHSSDKTLIKEDHNVMNFCIDYSERYALISLANQGLHLWDLEDKTLVRRYRGLTQGYYTIFSSFGGLNHDFIASGSEDHNVYIWHVKKERPIAVLSGHLGMVNAVSWNPHDPSMMASCSDDGTVRIWGPDTENTPTGDQNNWDVNEGT